jgi:uncharacterized membrane protein
VRRYGSFMPALMLLTIGSLRPGAPSSVLTLAGVFCLAAMLAVTLAGNVPINRKILAATLDTPPPTWWSLRRRWDRLHAVRVALDLVALVLLILAVLT